MKLIITAMEGLLSRDDHQTLAWTPDFRFTHYNYAVPSREGAVLQKVAVDAAVNAPEANPNVDAQPEKNISRYLAQAKKIIKD